MKGSICIGTNLNDKQTPFIIVLCVMYPIRGLNDLLLGPKYRKISLKSTLFAYLFKSHLLVPCFIAMDCIGHPCGDQ